MTATTFAIVASGTSELHRTKTSTATVTADSRSNEDRDRDPKVAFGCTFTESDLATSSGTRCTQRGRASNYSNRTQTSHSNRTQIHYSNRTQIDYERQLKSGHVARVPLLGLFLRCAEHRALDGEGTQQQAHRETAQKGENDRTILLVHRCAFVCHLREL